MYAFLILVGLALALGVLLRAVDELVPVQAPAALASTVGVALATGLAWLLDYSVFAAFAQPVRAEWLEYVGSGLVLVGVGELVRSLIGALARSGDDAATAPSASRVRAA